MKNKNKRILWTAVAACLLIAIVTVVVIIMMQRGKTEELDKSGDGATQVSGTPIPGQNENNDPDGTPEATPTDMPVETPEATPTPIATPEPFRVCTNLGLSFAFSLKRMLARRAW